MAAFAAPTVSSIFGEIDAELSLSMAGADYLMPGNERVDNGFADRAGCPDN